MEVKKKRKTYKDRVKYIESIRPILIKEKSILNGSDWKKVSSYFTQMKILGMLKQVPMKGNNWTLITSNEFSLYILKYEGVDFDEMKEEILKGLEEDDMEGNLEEEDTEEKEIDWSKLPKEKQELYKKIMERIKENEEKRKNEEDFFDMLDRIKGEKLSKQRIKRIETFLKYFELLEEVKPVLIEGAEIRASKEYAVTNSVLARLKSEGKIIVSPSSRNDWTITPSDSFLKSEKSKESPTEATVDVSRSTESPADTANEQDEFIKLSMSMGLTLDEAQDYWKHKDDEDEDE